MYFSMSPWNMRSFLVQVKAPQFKLNDPNGQSSIDNCMKVSERGSFDSPTSPLKNSIQYLNCCSSALLMQVILLKSSEK